MEVCIGANNVKVPPEHLDRQVLKVEQENRPSTNLQLSIYVGPVLPEGSAKKANRPFDLVRLLGPALSAAVARRGANIILGRKSFVTARPKEALLSVEANAPFDDRTRPRVLGDDTPEQLASPEKNLKTRLRRRRASGQVNTEDVAACMAVVANSLGDGGGEQAELPLSRRGYFTAIERSCQDERAHDLHLGRPAPGHAMQEVAKPNGCVKPASH